MEKVDLSNVPVEMVQELFGDEIVTEGDEVDTSIQRLVENATGVSLSPYSQEKMVLSDQISTPSSNAPMFSDIFGEGDIGADQEVALPQASFIRANESQLDNRTRFVPDPTPAAHRKPSGVSLHNRFIEKVTEMASQGFSKTNVPPDLALLVDQVSSGDRIHLQYQLAKRKKLLESLVVKVRKSRSLKFLLDKIQEKKGDFILSEKDLDELDRLRVIDTEIFDCEMLPTSS
jgi:hypothetical protein